MAIFGIDIEYDGNGFSELDIAGETLTAGDLCYLGTDSKYYKADANAKATSTTELRIALASIPINTSGLFLIKGKYTIAGLSSGDKYYVSETPGEFTNVQPGGTGTNVIRYIGTAHSATVMEFNPDETYVLADGTEVNEITMAGGGGSGHTIQDEGSNLTARTNLNFAGNLVTATDDSGNSATLVTITDPAAHTHSNFALLETYDQTNANITTAITNSHVSSLLGTNTLDESAIGNGKVITYNSTSGDLEFTVPTGSGVSDHTLLTNIGTNTHAQIDTHIADGNYHYTQASISITESQISDLGNYEDYLGTPAGNGYVLESTTGGTRSWSSTANWDTAYTHSQLTVGNPHQVTGAQVVLTGYVMPGTTSAVSSSDSTNAAIGKLEKAIEDITLSGGMTSFNIMEGNGTETTSVTNGETIHFEQGTGMQVELTSTASGGQLTFTNTSPNSNLIHTGEVTGATALTIASNVVDLDNLNVGGSPTTSKYLRYDSSGTGLIWAVPPDTDINTWRTVTAGGNTLGTTETLGFVAGSGVTITEAAGQVTINSTSSYSWDLEVDGVFRETIEDGENVSFDGGDAITISGTTVTNPNVIIGVTDNAIDAAKLDVTGNGTTAQYLRSDGDGSFTWATPVDNDTIYTGWDLYVDTTHRGNISSSENVNFVGGTGINVGYSATNNTVSFYTDGTFVRKDIADTKAGNLTMTTGNLILNTSLKLQLGTTTSESAIYSDGSNSFWDLASGNLLVRDGTTTRFTFNRTSGNFVSTGSMTATGFYESSDRDLKENIEPLDEKFVSFNFKGDETKRYGVIAQDIEEDNPELVKEEEHKSVNYIDLLILEIVELKKRVKELEDGNRLK